MSAKMCWTELASLPGDSDSDIQTSAMIRINKDEFIVAPHWPHAHFASSNSGLFTYNIHSNEWRLFMKYNEQYNPQWHTICFDEKRAAIYSSGNRSPLSIIDLKQRKFLNHDHAQHLAGIGSSACVVMAGDSCHLLGGTQSTKHYSFMGSKAMTLLSDLNVHETDTHVCGYSGFAAIYVSSQHRLMLFGGYKHRNDSKRGQRMNEIRSYHTRSADGWNTLPQRLPFAMTSFGIVTTSDEKFCITFGGFTGTASLPHIVIINLDTLNHVISPIKVPLEGALYHALKWDEKRQDEKLVNGWLRKYCLNMTHHRFSIDMITQRVVSAYSVEYVLLLSRSGDLWKMRIDDVLSSCKLP